MRCSAIRALFSRCTQPEQERRAAIFLRVDLCIDTLALSITRVAFSTGPIATPRQMSQAVGLLRLRSAPDPGLEMSAVLRSPGRYSSRANVPDKGDCGGIAHDLPLPTICCPKPWEGCPQSKPI